MVSRGDEFNLGLVMRLNHSELLCNKVLLKYKKIKEIEKASDIDIRRGQKEYPLASVSNGVIYLQLVITINQKNVWRLSRPD